MFIVFSAYEGAVLGFAFLCNNTCYGWEVAAKTVASIKGFAIECLVNKSKGFKKMAVWALSIVTVYICLFMQVDLWLKLLSWFIIIKSP